MKMQFLRSSLISIAVNSAAAVVATLDPQLDVSKIWPEASKLPKPVNMVLISPNEKRDRYHFYNCEDIKFSGRCANMIAKLGQCCSCPLPDDFRM
jgi:hypothetical protein